MPTTLMSRHLLGPAQRAMGLWFSRRYVEGERYACYNQTADEERRKTAAERRTGFDWLLFQVMLSDQARIDAYRRDIAATVPGKRVLEVGPGPAAVLSRLCLDAGAASVLSVEGDPWVAEHAERCGEPHDVAHEQEDRAEVELPFRHEITAVEQDDHVRQTRKVLEDR